MNKFCLGTQYQRNFKKEKASNLRCKQTIDAILYLENVKLQEHEYVKFFCKY